MMLNESNEEETVSDPFLQKLNDHILLGEQLVKGWSGGFLEVALRRANLVGLIHQVVLANCARQLRSLKSLLSVAEGGDSVAGSMLVRSMFETTINVGFVMKPVWNHQVRGKKEKLTQELRAQLYLLHTQLELSQRQTRAKDKANKKSQAKIVFDSDSIAPLPTLEKEVGAKWLKVLSAEPHTVTGESLETIAGMISPDLSAWYAVIEGEYPACNHAVGLNEFLRKNLEGEYVTNTVSSAESLQGVVFNGIYLTLTTLGFVDQYADIGIGGRSMLSGLRNKLNAIA